MGFRINKSYRLGKSGVRLNVSKSGLGMSAGVKGLRVGTGPRGSRLTASIPGTGISYQTGLGSKKRAMRQGVAPKRTALPAADAALLAALSKADAAALLAKISAPRPKSGGATFLLWLATGLVGGHRYYLGRTKTGALQTLTLGGAGLWWLFDLPLLGRMVRDANEARQSAWLQTPVGL